MLLFLAWLFPSAPAHGENLQLELEPLWHGQPLALHQARTDTTSAAGTPLTLRRIDGLISQVAVQGTNGAWIESKDWHAFFSVEKQRLSAITTGLPAEEFQAIRFRVGVDAETDSTDAQAWPPEHPLHPDVCGLHWGWRSGYVFLALEGHWNDRSTTNQGFSYHLAGAAPPMMVELPVKFSGQHPTHLRLGMDLATILDNGAVLRQATSTHSRNGDALAATLKQRVSGSFTVRSVRADTFQSRETMPSNVPTGRTRGAPYRLNISDRLPRVTLPADNPLTQEGVELGRRLFHEKKLSRHEQQSCASCHEQQRAFTDGRIHSLGESGQPGRRNSMSLANLAWAREFFWDGRARSIREQVLLPIQDAHEMNESLERVTAKLEADRAYQDRFNAAFGSPQVTPERLALALEQFLLTLVSQDSKFDRAARKLAVLTPQEQRGLQLFVTEHDPARGLRGADCFHCHGGNLFSNHQFMNNGLPARTNDSGRMEVTRLESDRGKFKVPSLRNVAVTAPYMHDGRFATLEEVIRHYNGPMHRSATLDPNLAKHPAAGLGLGADDQAALVAFLRTLTDEQFVQAEDTRPPESSLSKSEPADHPIPTSP